MKKCSILLFSVLALSSVICKSALSEEVIFTTTTQCPIESKIFIKSMYMDNYVLSASLIHKFQSGETTKKTPLLEVPCKKSWPVFSGRKVVVQSQVCFEEEKLLPASLVTLSFTTAGLFAKIDYQLSGVDGILSCLLIQEQ